jgi:hypothetical protein
LGSSQDHIGRMAIKATMVAKAQSTALASRVIVFSDRHAMLADVESSQRRLSDVVNDPLRHMFQLENVTINSVDRMDECLARHDRVSIKRDAIQAILILSEPARPPHQRLSNFIPKQAVRIAALLPALHITGNIFIGGKVDPTNFILDGVEAFAVLGDATVTMTSRTDKPINVQTALIHRSHILLATTL